MRTKLRSFLGLAIALIICLGLTGTALGEIWNQMPFYDEENGLTAYPSYTSGTEGQALADDFKLDYQVTINAVSWTGGNLSYVPLATDFAISFFELGADNKPINMVTKSVTVSGDNITSTGWDGYDDRFYTYSAALPGKPFVAEAGTHYWFSVQAVVAGTDPLWFWAITEDAQLNYAVLKNDGVWLNEGSGTDLAYSLKESPVPIPAAIWLFGAGILGLFGVRRRMTKA